MTISPALAGKTDNKWQVNSLYRNQSFGPGINYNTKLVSLDGRVFDNNDNNNSNYLGLGGMFMSEIAMEGIYKKTFFSLSSAYHITLDKYEGHNHSLTSGLGLVYNNTNIDYAGLNTGDQLSLLGFNKDLPTGETTLLQIPSTIAANAGLMYSYNSERDAIDIGVAGYKFYKNENSVFSNSAQAIKPRYDIYFNYSKMLDYRLLLFLKNYYQIQDGNSYFIGGGHLEYSFNEYFQDFQESLNIGLYYRLNNALIPYIGFSYDQLQFALSYDINVTKMKSASVVPRAFELSFIFKKRKKSWNPLL